MHSLLFRSTSFSILLVTAVLSVSAQVVSPPLATESTAILLRERAMAGDDIALDFVRELTTRFGPRPAGSVNEQAAAAWAADRFRSLGFQNVELQPFPILGWSRGREHAELTTAEGIVQPVVAVALGEAPATPTDGVSGQIVVFPDLESLAAVPDGSLTGKVVLVNRRMIRVQDRSGYSPISHIREKGPLVAARKGAVAFLLRQASTDNHRMGHTGATSFGPDGKVPIPAFALSNPDADQIERLKTLGGAVRIRLESSAFYNTGAHSQNVVGEIRGREKPDEVVLIGAHLDSWDQGTGAADDAAGDAIIVAAAKLIANLPVRPRRTIRVVLFGAEEIDQPSPSDDVLGAAAYLRAHEADVGLHVAVNECDHGPDRVYALSLPASVAGSDFSEMSRRVLDPIGILLTEETPPDIGLDVEPIVRAGAPHFTLRGDRTRMFDTHHTADDTFDKIDPIQLHQNVAAYAAVVWLIADSDVDFRKPSLQPKR